jgi:putative Mg2+ transporter-C (MgtC) family protein
MPTLASPDNQHTAHRERSPLLCCVLSGARVESKELLLAVLPGFLVQGAFAVLCGGIIGIEREQRGKPAGFRTNILICLGSTLYMLTGELLLSAQKLPGVDPTRIAAQVVTGIGFLGAGTILHSRGAVTGLTTAASIWVVAAIGLLIGAGFPALGLVTTLLVLATLEVMSRLESRILGPCRRGTLELTFEDPQRRVRAELALVLAEQNSEVCSHSFSDEGDRIRMKLEYCETHPTHHRFLAELLDITGAASAPRT